MLRKVLVIEEDITGAAFILKGLREAGFSVNTADNGRDGFFLATEKNYDAVVLDRMLPRLDGMAVVAVTIPDSNATASDREPFLWQIHALVFGAR